MYAKANKIEKGASKAYKRADNLEQNILDADEARVLAAEKGNVGNDIFDLAQKNYENAVSAAKNNLPDKLRSSADKGFDRAEKIVNEARGIERSAKVKPTRINNQYNAKQAESGLDAVKNYFQGVKENIQKMPENIKEKFSGFYRNDISEALISY